MMLLSSHSNKQKQQNKLFFAFCPASYVKQQICMPAGIVWEKRNKQTKKNQQ